MRWGGGHFVPSKPLLVNGGRNSCLQSEAKPREFWRSCLEMRCSALHSRYYRPCTAKQANCELRTANFCDSKFEFIEWIKSFFFHPTFFLIASSPALILCIIMQSRTAVKLRGRWTESCGRSGTWWKDLMKANRVGEGDKANNFCICASSPFLKISSWPVGVGAGCCSRTSPQFANKRYSVKEDRKFFISKLLFVRFNCQFNDQSILDGCILAVSVFISVTTEGSFRLWYATDWSPTAD